MDSKTADSLFAADDDTSADFFASSDPDVEDDHAQNFHHAAAPEPISYQPQYAQQSSEPTQDPYSQLRSGVTSQPTAVDQSSATWDPYSPQIIRNERNSYTPNVSGSASTTYGQPSSQAGSYDPYAQVSRAPPVTAPSVSNYDPYATALGPPKHSYTPVQTSPYAPSINGTAGVPTPQISTPVDVSKYRSAPNAYDPPIRSTPVVRSTSRINPAPAPPPLPPAAANPPYGYSNTPPPPQASYQTPPPPARHTALPQQSPPVARYGTPSNTQQYGINSPVSPPKQNFNARPPPPPAAAAAAPPLQQSPPVARYGTPSNTQQYGVASPVSPPKQNLNVRPPPPPAAAAPPQPQPQPPAPTAAPTPPPPRAVSPYIYRPSSAASHPPPRPGSTASNKSVGPILNSRPPNVQSRPTSAASVTRASMRSPPRAHPATSPLSGSLTQLEESGSADMLEYPPRDVQDTMDPDPTPTISSSQTGASNYLAAHGSPESPNSVDPYKPSLSTIGLTNPTVNQTSPVKTPNIDPYAPVKSNLGTIPVSSSAPQPITRQSTYPSIAKAAAPPRPIPPPRVDSYKPIPNGLAHSVSFSDSYAPTTYNQTPASRASLLPGNSDAVVDLSHSPPSTKHAHASMSAYDPYNTVSNSNRNRTASEPPDHFNPYNPPPPNPQYGYMAPQKAMSPDPTATSGLGPAQYVSAPSLLSQAAPTAYAPSPSLLGTNDPLGRASVRVPIFSFGFGGQVVTCFHNIPGAGAFDGMAPGRPATQLQVKVLKDIIPSSAYDVTEGSFPGPLFNDQGAGGATSVLQTAAAATKAKKAALIQFIDARIAEIEQGLGYVSSDADGGVAKAEGKLLLIQLLKAFVEHDGKLSGNVAAEEAVRNLLVGPVADADTSVTGASLAGFSAVPPFYAGALNPSSNSDPTVASYQVKGSALDRIEELLLRGDKKQAYRYALDEKLWAHALLISSSVDKESWKEVAHEFIKTELSRNQRSDGTDNPLAGREALQIAYGLFAGDGSAAMKLLLPPAKFGVNGVQAHGRISSEPIPLTPENPIMAANSIPEQTLAQWKKLLASVISNQATGDSSATTALGDCLSVNKWIDAAHCCYLLSLGTSAFSGVAPGTRMVLLGFPSPATPPSFHIPLQPIIFSEIAEYAMSLVPAVKGQEPFHGLPHLQAYRFWHATCLAEMGEVNAAKRYTDAINTTIRSTTRGSPFYTPTFLEQLEELHSRLIEAPHADKTKAWISKPTVRSLNDWIQGGIEKLIQGDEAAPAEASTEGKKSLEIPTVGPFSHYSAISSASPSTAPSPSPSFSDLRGVASVGSPYTPSGTGAGAGGYRPPPTHSSTLPPPPPPRAASALDFPRGRASPAPKVVSAGASMTSFAHSTVQNPYQGSKPPSPTGDSSNGQGAAPRPLYAQWWSEGAENDGVTPTASSFVRGEEQQDSGEFVSLMDSEPTLMPSMPNVPTNGKHSSHASFDDNEDDLGFGNSRKSKQDTEDEPTDEPERAQTAKPVAPSSQPVGSQKPAQLDQAAPAAKGWFSWLRRDNSTPKPVVAKLGEENAFYYDADLGRWVNKKAGAEATAPKGPPPPPSRAQTASPGRAGIASNTATPPPPRAASVMPPTPSKLAPPRPSSSLSSTSGESPTSLSDSGPPSRASPAPPPQGPFPPRNLGQTPPPPTGSPAGGRPGAKRNARSRYVDVFQAS